MGRFSRFRHGRGFGVHSPFAYRFITEVLREKLWYYDYHQLPRRNDRLLYRVVNHFRPGAICAPPQMLRVAAMATPYAVATDAADADFVAYDRVPDTDEIIHLLQSERVIYLDFRRDESLMRAIIDVLSSKGRGMVFVNRRSLAIVVNYRHLPHQIFEAKF